MADIASRVGPSPRRRPGGPELGEQGQKGHPDQGCPWSRAFTLLCGGQRHASRLECSLVTSYSAAPLRQHSHLCMRSIFQPPNMITEPQTPEHSWEAPWHMEGAGQGRCAIRARGDPCMRAPDPARAAPASST